MNILNWLYFALGFLSLVPFASRFFIQWLLSERAQKSHVTKIFWHLSIWGNILLISHHFIQVQFHLYFIRIFTLYFAIRQLKLMQQKASPFSWSSFIKVTSCCLIAFISIFMLRVYLQYQSFIWIQTPQMPWQSMAKQISSFWHTLGFIGSALFTSRMWIQWWQSEKAQKSYFSLSFWYMSIIGGSLTLTYALYSKDIVLCLSYGTGLIPYVRNLMLMYKERAKLKGIDT